MNRVVYCMWARMDYPDRYCNNLALPGDDLCYTHRGHVDSRIRIFDRQFQDHVNYGGLHDGTSN